MTWWYLLRFIGMRHLARSLTRSLVTLVGIAIGVGVLVAVSATNEALVASFEGMVDKVAGKADLVLGGAGTGLDENKVAQVAGVEGVAHVAPAVEQIVSAPGLNDRLMVLGVDFLGDPYFLDLSGADPADQEILQDPLAFLNSDNYILVTRDFADRHHLKRGSTFDLLTPDGVKLFEVYGVLEARGLGAAYGGAVGVMYIGAAQVALGRGSRYDRVDIAVAEGRDVDQVAAAVRTSLGHGFQVRRPEDLGARSEQMTSLFRQGLQMTSGLALLVGLALIFNTVGLSVLQRRREMGILRAFGATRGQVQRMVLLEGAVLGVVGGVIGVGLGLLMARTTLAGASETVNSLYVRVKPEQAQVSTTLILLGVATGVVTACLAAWGPARTASHVQPVQVLRREVIVEGPHPGWLRRRLTWGAVVLGVGGGVTLLPVGPELALPVSMIAMLGVLVGLALVTPAALWAINRVMDPVIGKFGGITARMASDNILRGLSRASANVASLAGAIVMVVAIGSYLQSFLVSVEQWLTDSIPSHLFVTSGSRVINNYNTLMKPELGQEMLKLPHMKYMYNLRISDQTYRDQAVRILSMEFDEFLKASGTRVVSGPPLEAPPLQDPASPAVVISESMAVLFDLNPGDDLALESPTGTRHFKVMSVIIDYSSNLGYIYMDRGFYVEGWQDPLVDSFEYYLDDLQYTEQVRTEIMRRWGDDYDLFVLTNGELRQEVEGAVRQFFDLTHSLTFIAIVVALLGIVNTLYAEVLDRTREIGMLRAIGTLRSQVARMVVLEAFYMGAAATLLGGMGGLLVGKSLVQTLARVQTGWTLPFAVPWSTLILVSALAVGVSLVAGWLPARKAARMSVVEALSWE